MFVQVNEVIQKFITQEQTHSNLVNMTREAQGRIDALAEERVTTKATVDEMKYSGAGNQSTRHEVEEVCNHPYLFQGAEITIDVVSRRLLLMTAGTFHSGRRSSQRPPSASTA